MDTNSTSCRAPSKQVNQCVYACMHACAYLLVCVCTELLCSTTLFQIWKSSPKPKGKNTKNAQNLNSPHKPQHCCEVLWELYRREVWGETSSVSRVWMCGLTTASLVGAVGTVFVSVTLQDLRETFTHVSTRELAEGASHLSHPGGQQHWGTRDEEEDNHPQHSHYAYSWVIIKVAEMAS